MKIKGTTTSGFSYEIEKDSLDDYELFELIASGDFTAVPKVIERILGEEQKKRLLESLRGENGRVKMTDMEKALFDIFQNPKLKN